MYSSKKFIKYALSTNIKPFFLCKNYLEKAVQQLKTCYNISNYSISKINWGKYEYTIIAIFFDDSRKNEHFSCS